jgi:PTS system nitrogen regulatory IIA component
MHIKDILTVDRILYDIQATSKKRALEELSGLIAKAHPSLSARTIFDCLLARERLGSTGLGFGVALPHGRLAKLGWTIGAFIKIREPVNFDALDKQPVDLMFGLLVPEHSTEEHLQILSLLAEKFSDESLRTHLRQPISAETAFILLTLPDPVPRAE